MKEVHARCTRVAQVRISCPLRRLSCPAGALAVLATARSIARRGAALVAGKVAMQGTFCQ
jgi:2-keto-4-pentenoate hydratase